MASSATNYVTILGVGGEVGPSLCISTRAERILINCPEDLILKTSEEGRTGLRLVGPRIREYVMSTSYFLGARPDMTLHLMSLPSSGSALPQSMKNIYVAGGVQVFPILVHPHLRGVKRSIGEISSHNENPEPKNAENDSVEKKCVVPESAAASLGAVRDDGETQLTLCYTPYHRNPLRSKREKVRTAPYPGHADVSVCYAVVLPDLPGKLDVQMAAKLGVPKGKLLGQLVKGQPVTLPDGTVVDPSQCVAPSLSAGVVLVIDCPTDAHLQSISALSNFQDFQLDGARSKGNMCLIHMAPPGVLRSTAYRAWVSKFPQTADVNHIVLNALETPIRPPFCASERYLKLLHREHPGIFPLSHSPYRALSKAGNAISGKQEHVMHDLLACNSGMKCVYGWPMQRCVLLPHKTPGLVDDVPETGFLHRNCKRVCTCSDTVEEEDRAPDVSEMRVVFLGTGASAPFKYRTVSSIYLELAEGGGVILDAGDGSYGTLVRKYGKAWTEDILIGLKMLFVSHKHADHISGVARLLLERSAALKRRGLTEAGPGGGGQRPCVCAVCGASFSFASSADMHHRACHPREKRTKGLCDAVEQGTPEGTVQPLLVVGPMWLEAWLGTLSEIEANLSFSFLDAQELVKESKSHSDRIRELIGGSARCVLVQHSFPAYGIVLKLRSNFTLVYSGDTRPCDELIAAGKGATLLIHEATHADDMQQKAESDRHCTVREAVDVASRMEARHVILTHFSSRFEKLIPDLKEYGDKSKHISCALDGMEITESDLDQLPALSLRVANVLAQSARQEYGEDVEGDD